MSSRTTLRPQTVIIAGDMSDDFTSDTTILQSLSRVSYGVSWSGATPVGTLAIEGSNDYSVTPAGTEDNAGTWTTMTVSVDGSPVNSIPVTGNTGSILIDIATGIYAIRLAYTSTSGTGTMIAKVTGKVS